MSRGTIGKRVELVVSIYSPVSDVALAIAVTALLGVDLSETCTALWQCRRAPRRPVGDRRSERFETYGRFGPRSLPRRSLRPHHPFQGATQGVLREDLRQVRLNSYKESEVENSLHLAFFIRSLRDCPVLRIPLGRIEIGGGIGAHAAAEGIGACAAGQAVTAQAAAQDIVIIPAVEDIVAVLAIEDVVPVPAIERIHPVAAAQQVAAAAAIEGVGPVQAEDHIDAAGPVESLVLIGTDPDGDDQRNGILPIAQVEGQGGSAALPGGSRDGQRAIVPTAAQQDRIVWHQAGVAVRGEHQCHRIPIRVGEAERQ